MCEALSRLSGSARCAQMGIRLCTFYDISDSETLQLFDIAKRVMDFLLCQPGLAVAVYVVYVMNGGYVMEKLNL